MKGGKRKGAGRKPAPPRQGVTVRISPDAAQRLRAYCTAHGISQAKAIERWALGSKRSKDLPYPPDEIWLQWHGEGDPSDGDPMPTDEVTWSDKKIWRGDVKYGIKYET
jgi:hypothetical protein